MLGAIIGDIAGSRFEFNPTNDYNFELFGEGCSFTDDTICTIAIADAILRNRDYGESLHEWCRRYPNPKGGYGGRFRQWVLSDKPEPYNSFGNGSAMRVSPIAWWFVPLTGMHREAAKSASCTHNHPSGIDGASAVVSAISDCNRLRKEKRGQQITREDILCKGLHHAIQKYRMNTQTFDVNIEDYRNKFDETCQGTVPVALAIILNSTSFEDAIRQAVSLGADADTLGAIVGSIAEALWGIPKWMKKKAMSYLPDEMKDVVREFRKGLNRRRKLSEMCPYCPVYDHNDVVPGHITPLEIEMEWIDELAKDISKRDEIKAFMRQVMPINRWQDIADEYALPLTLVGKILQKHTSICEINADSITVFEEFMEEHYKHVSGKRRENLELKKQNKALMRWKLGLGNMSKALNGENPMPDKTKTATPDMWNVTPIPEADKSIITKWESGYISHEMMDILRKGHIPEALEDHWFMYVDERDNRPTIHYVRSWTGNEAFVVHLIGTSRGFLIDKVEINRNLCEFGVNGDEAGKALLIYLIVAEANGDAEAAWENYLDAWEELNKKYSKRHGK